MSQTASMRRAARWLAEERADAATVGQVLPDLMVALYEHIAQCPGCELRANNDPDLCEVADEIMDQDGEGG